MNYRKKEDIIVVRIPKVLVDENRGEKCGKCCSNQVVLASLTENESYKNDFTGVHLKKGDVADVVTWTMEDCNGLVVSNQGEEAVFPNDETASGYIYDWNKILMVHGAGSYTIKVDYTIAGITGGHTVRTLDLKKFSIPNAKGSIRMYSEFNSYSLKENIDFTGSNFKDTIRTDGFFGSREPSTEINNIIDKSRNVLKVTRENLNKYTLETDPINIGMTKQMLDFHFLNEDVLLMSDFNRFNHDFQLFDIPIVLIDEPKIEYIKGDRRAKIIATFGDSKLLDKSYYR